jgi:beta-glucosidase
MKTFPMFKRVAVAAVVLTSTLQLVNAAEETKAAAPAAPAPTQPAAAPAKPVKKPRTPEDALTPAIKDPNRHEQFLQRIKEGEVGLLFLGDSITDAWPRAVKASWEKFAPYKPADFGISGDRTEHVLWRITNGELEGIAPKVTVIMIGTNNIGHFSDEKPEWAAAGVKKIVDIVHEKLPNTKVLLLGVFPRGTPESSQRKSVEAINQIISGYADGKKTKYLDVSKSFLDENGNIPADVMPDKLHPNSKGYDIWYEAMWPVLQDMLK